MIKHTLLPLAACTGLLLSGAASAVELTDVDSAPHSYVKKVVFLDPDTGEQTEKYQFGSRGVIWHAESWNQIFAAYGLEFDADYVDDVPKSYCRLVEIKNENGEKETVMKFNDRQSIVWSPETLDRILGAYGLTLDAERIADLPSEYATLVDVTNENGEMEQVVDFGNDNVIWYARTFNQILSAYN